MQIKYEELPESIRISPTAKRLIEQNKIPYKQIVPTGIRGMITHEDVL